MSQLTKKQERFVETVWNFYAANKREHLPWRQTQDPYKVLVSELMLQQTQVDRVIPKYNAFIKRWPTARHLASASLADVLKAWQGLGYNRRAKFLHQAAKAVVNDHNGVFPQTTQKLQTLPGVGPYTASAVAVFAYDHSELLIETNVRQVFLHHFFKQKTDVADKEILQLIKRTLPVGSSREWYAALMDYGSYLKKTYGNVTQRSAQYAKQSRFQGSDRQIRGAILRFLSDATITESEISKHLDFEEFRVKEQLGKLCREGLIARIRNTYSLPR